MQNLTRSGDLLSWTATHRRLGERAFSLAGHQYLKDIYRDESPYMVIRKAAQMGASEYAISRALHFATCRGGRIIYFFPTDKDVREFSKDRFAPALREDAYDRREMVDPHRVILKNGRPALQSHCPVCGTKMARIVKAEPQVDPPPSKVGNP